MSEELEELLTGYVLNTLSLDEVEKVEKMLQQQPELLNKLAQLEEINGLIALSCPQVKAPTILREKVLNLAQEASVVNVRKNKNIPWQKIATASIAIVTAILGFDNYLLRQKFALLNTNIIEHEQENYLFYLKGTKHASNASGNIFLDLKKQKVVIALKNLPSSTQGEVYHLWAFTKNQKILCGRFNTNQFGELISELPLPVEQYKGEVLFMKISRELPLKDYQANPNHPKTLVMTSES